MTTILVFGTSTAYGFWDIEGGWVQRLRRYIDEKQMASEDLYFAVYNLGVSGDTSRGMAQRMEAEIKSRIFDDDEGEETIVIISVGVNDSIVNHLSGECQIPLDIFKENVKEMLEIARKYTRKIIFVGNKPVDESRLDPIPWLPGNSYKEELVEKYDKSVAEFCLNNGIPFIDVYDAFRKEKEWKKLLDDGVHPSAGGHKLIFETVKTWLVNHKVIP